MTFHMSDDLGGRFPPSEHVPIRIVIPQPGSHSNSCDQVQSWFVKHPILCFMLKQFHGEHVYLDEAFAVADFKLLVGEAKTRARHELLRATPSSHGAKLFSSGDSDGSISQQTLGYIHALL